VRRPQEHPEPAVQGGGGHEMIDDDLVMPTRSTPPQPAPFEALFPSLPTPAAPFVPWAKPLAKASGGVVLSAGPSPRPSAMVTVVNAASTVVAEGILLRNIRMKEALGLCGAEGTKLEAAAKERLATLWPPALRRWCAEEPSEVLKLEAKVAGLLADPRGTSVTLKPMATAKRRLVYLWSEFYGLRGRSDDDGDRRGKSMSLILASGVSCAPWPLLSEADRFERANPHLIDRARLAVSAASASQVPKQRSPRDESSTLLLSRVPDLMRDDELRALLFAAGAEALSLWRRDVPSAALDDGFSFAAEFRSPEAASRVFRGLRESHRQHFDVEPWPSRHTVLRGSAEDSWGADDSCARGAPPPAAEKAAVSIKPVASPVASAVASARGDTARAAAEVGAELIESWELLATEEAPTAAAAEGGAHGGGLLEVQA